jgi:zinc/manganese transport system substrate-binding protein
MIRFATILSVALLLGAPLAVAAPLRVCATLSNLGSIVEEVGGDDVVVTTFAKGTEDPHFIEARPSFMKALNEADLLVLNGLELEIGWLPVLIEHAHNPAILPGGPGYLDASTVVTPLGVPQGPVSRALGDVHGLGNPHYLLDPIAGLRVAAAVRDARTRGPPQGAAAVAARDHHIRRRRGAKHVGGERAARGVVE